MRTIKFRAWDRQREEMVFDFAINSDGSIGQTGFSCDYDCNNVKDVTGDWIATGEENQLVWCVMQFTGMKDKNGKEIYEGDIVKQVFADQKTTGEVKIEASRGVVVKNVPVWIHDAEVIGNIYENPELIKE